MDKTIINNLDVIVNLVIFVVSMANILRKNQNNLSELKYEAWWSKFSQES
jgi:hypothetical protein